MVFETPLAQVNAHSWMPASPCGPTCIEPIEEVGSVRVLARLFGAAGLLISFPIVNIATPRDRREQLHRRYARLVLGCLGMRLQVVDQRPFASQWTGHTADDQVVGDVGDSRAVRGDGATCVDRSGRAGSGSAGFAEPGAGLLVVAGHIGWTDVVVLAAVQPLGFVARADMVGWPLLGGLAKRMRVIPIERERLRALPNVVAHLAARLAAGDRIAMFPEGTTWCGRAYGGMRPALFQAAIDTETPVQPVRLRYLDRHGSPCTVPGFVGEDSFVTSTKRVLRSRGIVAQVVLAPLESPGVDRRDLARRCALAVRGAQLSRHGAHLTGDWIEASATRVLDPLPQPGNATAPIALPPRAGNSPESVRRGVPGATTLVHRGVSDPRRPTRDLPRRGRVAQ